MGKKVTLVTLTINRPTINKRRRTPPFSLNINTALSLVEFFSIRDKRRRRMKNKGVGGGGGEGKNIKEIIKKKKKRKEKKKEVTSNVSSSRDQLFACATN